MISNYITAQPEAFITTNKNRRKVQGNNVYLDNNSSFEIELFNPTSQVLLVKIKINGNYISDRGIVLNPGVRVFLERHIDSPEKFLFSTYSVSRDNQQVQKAIENNGLVEIEFYPEKIKPIYNPIVIQSPPFAPSPWERPYQYDWNQTIGTTNHTSGSVSFYSSSADLSRDFINFEDEIVNDEVAPKSRKLSKSTMETGRVEKGEVSNQTFKTVNKEFESFYTSIVTYKFLPMSEKPTQVNELVKFCGNCGRRKNKKEFTFCPSCGNKL